MKNYLPMIILKIINMPKKSKCNSKQIITNLNDLIIKTANIFPLKIPKIHMIKNHWNN